MQPRDRCLRWLEVHVYRVGRRWRNDGDVHDGHVVGREREIRNFVAKVILGPGDGADAAVGVRIYGLSIGQELICDVVYLR